MSNTSNNKNRKKKYTPNNNTNSTKNTTPKNEDSNKDKVLVSTSFKIPRTLKPGKVNSRNIRYDLDSYKTIINENKDLFTDAEVFFVGNDSPYKNFDYDRFRKVDIQNSGCKILEVANDYIKCVPNDDILDIIKTALKENKISAEMRSLGYYQKTDEYGVKVYNLTKIIGFDIIITGDYPYDTYVGYCAHKESKQDSGE